MKTKSSATTKTAKKKPASSARSRAPTSRAPSSTEHTPAVAARGATYDDLRARALELVAKDKGATWSAYLVEHFFARWVRETPDDEAVRRWIASLSKGSQAQAAGLAASERARAGAIASAQGFLALAESRFNPKARELPARELAAVVPAWWRLGKSALATAGFARLVAAVRTHPLVSVQTLVATAVLGGRYDLAREHIERAFDDEREAGVRLALALEVALAEREHALVDALFARWDACESPNPSGAVELALLRHFADDPAGLLSLVRARPRLFASCGAIALRALESRDLVQAKTIARALLAEPEVDESSRLEALAQLARHEPAVVAAWKHPRDAQLAALAIDTWEPPQLAALGRTREARAALVDDSDLPVLREVAQYTPDRGLAGEAWGQLVELDAQATLVPLVALGERARVDARLEARLAAIAKLAPDRRDPRCRALAFCAAEVGRVDLAARAVALAPPRDRASSARAVVRGCVSVADYDGALTALASVPDEGSGRVSAALQEGLGTRESILLAGAEALGLRCLVP